MLFIIWLLLTYVAASFVRTDSKKQEDGESENDETAMLARLVLCLLCFVGPLVCLALPVTRWFILLMGGMGIYLIQQKNRLSLLVGVSLLAGSLISLGGIAYLLGK